MRISESAIWAPAPIRNRGRSNNGDCRDRPRHGGPCGPPFFVFFTAWGITLPSNLPFETTCPIFSSLLADPLHTPPASKGKAPHPPSPSHCVPSPLPTPAAWRQL